MPLTEIVGGQARIYHDNQLIPHTTWGEILYVPHGTAKKAIEKSNSEVILISAREGKLTHRWAMTPARELPKILGRLAGLISANGPSVYYGEIVKAIDLSKDFSFKTPRGTVIFSYPNPQETETAAE